MFSNLFGENDSDKNLSKPLKKLYFGKNTNFLLSYGDAVSGSKKHFFVPHAEKNAIAVAQ